MSALPFSITAQDAVQGQPAADVQHHRGVLNALIDMGAQLATAVHAKAMCAIEAPNPTPPPAHPEMQDPTKSQDTAAPDLTIAFDRVARTVRRTILLARHVAEPPKAARPYAARGRIGRTRKPLDRASKDVTSGAASGQANPDSHDTPESLERPERPERLELSELDAREIAETFAKEIGDRRIEAIIAEIRRDLGQQEELPGNAPPHSTPASMASRRTRPAAPSVERPGPAPLAASETPAPAMAAKSASIPRPAPHRAPILDPPPPPMPDRSADPPDRQPGPPRTTTPASQACVNAPA